MLPDIVGDHRLVAIHDRTVLVGQRDDLEGALLVHDQPHKSAAETTDATSLELGLELVKGAKGLGDRLGKLADRCASLAWSHDLPEEGVVGVSATVVTDSCADALGHNGEVGDQVVHRLGSQLRVILEGVVEVVDVGGVVLVVMDLHRAGINMRLKSIESVGKRRQRVGHRYRA